ncbi:homoserine dehydrogenase [Pseudorhodoferax sp. Leaf274]|uniref:homoserine dehydrogenase n=1 Tax=Pseudorhodoferax sp. Leaf274 TaxID=1736318 RepID=UPI000702542E|nr:homoserine dehydrogenase [Pseudorhodoferax sp. Leaf274]KQP37850.1 homoserine dehydrogenase [Pseudorhodoferax sp. Leaf274]
MYRDPFPAPLPQSAAPPAQQPLRVGMIGIGTVGSGTFRVLARNQAEIAGRAGRAIAVTMVAARDLARAAGIVGAGVQLTRDPFEVATHPDIDVVVEVAGGTGPALDWVLAAIAHGKHVVTANKALLAVHGDAVFEAARRQGVAVAYEGAVAVSIPIVKALREGLTANRIGWVAGIVNGTTNFILSKMRDEGLDFGSALAQAQALGYAEADPSFDVDGIDAAHKMALLAANAFGTPVRFADVQVQGIRHLQSLDMDCAAQLGHRIKLLGIARRRPDGLEVRVQPALVPDAQLLAHVHGSMNGIVVHGDASGVTMYYGAGAGSEPTASAVIADLVDVARLSGTQPAQRVPHRGFHAHAMRALPVLPHAAVRSAHYLRVPLRCASDAEPLRSWLAAQGLTPRSAVLADLPAHQGAQWLVLTDTVLQEHVDGVLDKLRTHRAVAGDVTALHVEPLAA